MHTGFRSLLWGARDRRELLYREYPRSTVGDVQVPKVQKNLACLAWLCHANPPSLGFQLIELHVGARRGAVAHNFGIPDFMMRKACLLTVLILVCAGASLSQSISDSLGQSGSSPNTRVDCSDPLQSASPDCAGSPKSGYVPPKSEYPPYLVFLN